MKTTSALLLAAACAARAGAQDPAPSPEPPAARFEEGVEVTRVTMEVRVLDGQGRPVKGLAPADVRLTVDGREVAVESLDWIDAQTPTVLPPGAATPVAAGRQVVFLFQKALDARSSAGLLKMARRAREVIDSLAPLDQVAICSFDTRLRLWLDFSTDRAKAKEAVERGVVMNRPLAEVPHAEPSLRERLAADGFKRATSMEKSMLALGQALSGLPGERSLVLVGSHLGRGPSVLVAEEYEKAQGVLARARVPVYSLDTVEADRHTLEAGLQAIAYDTGGFFARTHDFPAQAVDRLKGALEGHYLLSFAKPEGKRGEHYVEISVPRGGARVLARPGYVD